MREGANTITVKRYGQGQDRSLAPPIPWQPDVILRVPPGRYTSKKNLIDEINKLLLTVRPGYTNHDRKSYYPELTWSPAVAAVP